MRYEQGDLLEAGLQAWGHGVNTQALMGAGIAHKVRKDYPEVFDSYRLACLSGELIPGGFQAVEADDGTIVYNLATQDLPGKHAQYDWLATSMDQALRDAAERDLTEFGLPQIGCGIGGLEWEKVDRILGMFQKAFPQIEMVVYSL